MTAASVTVAAIYYVYNMKATLQTRQAQLFMQLFDRFSGEELSRHYGKIRYEIAPLCHDSPEEFAQFVKQHEHEKWDPELWAPVHQLGLFYDGVAVLVKKKLIDLDLVEDLLADRLVWYWKFSELAYAGDRSYQGPQLGANFEWLADEMMRRQEKPTAA